MGHSTIHNLNVFHIELFFESVPSVFRICSIVYETRLGIGGADPHIELNKNSTSTSLA